MYITKITRFATLTLLLGTIVLISSCGSDDEEMDPGSEAGEVALSFTLNGSSETAVFNSGSAFLGLSDGQTTVLSTSGALTSGTNYAFAATFVGTSTGSYAMSTGAGDDGESINGLSLVIIDGQNSVSYLAKNITMTVTSYTVVSAAQIEISGTFSGTLENEETLAEATVTNGIFTTGFIN